MALALGWTAWFVLGVLVLVVVALARDIARPDLIMLGALGLVLVAGILQPEEAFAGFSNNAVLAIASLFVVAAGLERTNALAMLNRLLFDKGNSIPGTLARFMLPTSLLSGFLNNTPIVAMLLPRVQDWASSRRLPPSKLLIPLSYAAIIGGMVTLIGTSTNVVVSGLMEGAGVGAMGMFDLSAVGLPAAVAVALFFVLGGHRLLPDRGVAQPDDVEGLDDALFEVRVAEGAPFIDRNIEEADLRDLASAYLVHILRADHVIPARPTELLQAGDVLTFAGDVSLLDDLLKRPGFERVVSVKSRPDRALPLFEAVVAESSTLVGRTLRQARFRDRFGGVVLAIQRKNEQASGSLGRMPIKAGDLLLIESVNGFDRRWNRNRTEFYLVAPRRSRTAIRKSKRAPIALLILSVMIVSVTAGWLPLVTATFAAALGMIATRCLRFSQARSSVDVGVLIVIGAALGIGKAVEATGLAAALADTIVLVTGGFGVLAALVVLYVTTNVLTELITHKAAAVLMFPVALGVADAIGAPPKPFALLVAIAAAASFMTPIGYQTNLMVMSAGGYRYRDYIRVGLPVSVIVMTIAVTVIYQIWL